MNVEQYGIICSRRQSINDKVWEVPSLATAAQAFLLASALSVQTPDFRSLALSVFSLIVGAASYQLMAKHRQLEVEDSERLAEFERQHAAEGYEILHGKNTGVPGIERSFVTKVSSYKVWSLVLMGFVLLAGYAIVSDTISLVVSR